MPTPIRTLTDTIGWEQARIGKSRLTANDWAAGPTVDDCALFQSVAVFGSQLAWNVDVFKTLSGGTYHAGKAGLRRGDVILFDWNGNGIADHTEMALTAPDQGGNFTTIGANGSDTIAVAQRTRNTYVLGYFRPAYPTTKPTTTTPRSKDVSTIYKNQDANPDKWVLAGDSAGTAANWIETTNASLGAAWEKAHGTAVVISAATFANFKDYYRSAVNTTAKAAVSVDTAALVAAIQAGMKDALNGVSITINPAK
jgi:hypothetical protein